MWRHICVEVLVVHGMGLYMDLWVDSHHKRLHILYMCYACKPYLYPWLRTWCQGLNLCGQPEEKSGAEWSDFVCTMFHHGLLTENLKKNSEQNEVTPCVQCFITGFLQKIGRKFRSRMKWLRAYNISSRASYRKSEENFGAEWSDFVRTMFHHRFLTENLKKNSEQNEVPFLPLMFPMLLMVTGTSGAVSSQFLVRFQHDAISFKDRVLWFLHTLIQLDAISLKISILTLPRNKLNLSGHDLTLCMPMYWLS
jgi:hypothetical protein